MIKWLIAGTAAMSAMSVPGVAVAEDAPRNAGVTVVDFFYKVTSSDDQSARVLLAPGAKLEIEDWLAPGGKIAHAEGAVDFDLLRRLTSHCLVTLPASIDEYGVKQIVPIKFCDSAPAERQWSSDFEIEGQKIVKISMTRYDPVKLRGIPAIKVVPSEGKN